jgi:hypothetical protein
VHFFSRDGTVHERKAPGNIFTEIDLYTIKMPDGSRDLRLEHGLSDLEDAFAIARRDFLAHRKQLPTVRYAKMILFAAAMHARTPSTRDHHAEFWGEIVKAGEELRGNMKKATPEERERAAALSFPSSDRKGISLDQAKKIATRTMEHLLGPLITAEAPLLSRMKCAVLCTDDPQGFVTSDDPVVWFDREAYKRPPTYRSPAFMYKSLEVMFPISPQQALLFTHGEPGLSYYDIGRGAVSEFNRIVIGHCGDHFVTSRNYLDPHWFLRAPRPADAWENTTEAKRYNTEVDDP